MGNVKTKFNHESYKIGVEEATDVDIVLIDTREIIRSGKNDVYTFLQGLKEQLDAKVPGIADRLEQRDMLEAMANEFISGNPFAFSPRSMNRLLGTRDSDICVINTPDAQMYTKDAFLKRSLGLTDEQLKNFPGTDDDWLRLIGNHEGSHCDSERLTGRDIAKLKEETRADRATMIMLIERDQPELALAWKDFRALTAIHGASHATGIFLGNDDKPNLLHVKHANNIQEEMNQRVSQGFDWKNYDGQASTPQELLREAPEQYFETLKSTLDTEILNKVESYNESRTLYGIFDVAFLKGSYNTLADMNSLNALEAYIDDYEDAYRRRFLGQDIPARNNNLPLNEWLDQKTQEIENRELSITARISMDNSEQYAQQDTPDIKQDYTIPQSDITV